MAANQLISFSKKLIFLHMKVFAWLLNRYSLMKRVSSILILQLIAKYSFFLIVTVLFLHLLPRIKLIII